MKCWFLKMSSSIKHCCEMSFYTWSGHVGSYGLSVDWSCGAKGPLTQLSAAGWSWLASPVSFWPQSPSARHLSAAQFPRRPEMSKYSSGGASDHERQRERKTQKEGTERRTDSRCLTWASMVFIRSLKTGFPKKRQIRTRADFIWCQSMQEQLMNNPL